MQRIYKTSKFSFTIYNSKNKWKIQNFQIYTTEFLYLQQQIKLLNITSTQEIFSQNLFKNTIIKTMKPFKDNHENYAQYTNKFNEYKKKINKVNTEIQKINKNQLVILTVSKQDNISQIDMIQEAEELHQLINNTNASFIIKQKQQSQDEELIAQNIKKFNQTWSWINTKELIIYKDRKVDLDLVDDPNFIYVAKLIAIIKNQQVQIQDYQFIMSKQAKIMLPEYYQLQFGGEWIITAKKEVIKEAIIDTDYKHIYKFTIETNPEALILKNSIMIKQYLSVMRNEIMNEQIQQIIKAYAQIKPKEYTQTLAILPKMVGKMEILRRKKCINMKQGKIDSRIIQQTYLGNTKRNMWSTLTEYYKHQQREIFFSQEITKSVWKQIAEFFNGRLENYKHYQIELSITMQTGYQKYITPSQICVPKSNAIDWQGFNAKTIIANLTRNMVKNSMQRDENGNKIVVKKWVNILLGPYIASILSKAGYQNIARTFYFLKKDEININDFAKIRLLYVLPMTIRLFESTIFDVISRSIAKKVNEAEVINFGSIKGSSPTQMIQELKEIYQNNPHAAIIQCDISKAFDTVKYDILRQATDYYYGNQDQNLLQTKNALYRKLILKWIDIIENMASYNNKNSKFLYKAQGVPMGSSLAPIMFVMYLNYALRNYKYKRISYSDDTYVIVSQNTEEIKLAIKSLEEELAKANMKLNISKSKLIVQNANSNEQIQKLQIQLNIQIKSNLDVLGMVLSMTNLTQIRNQSNTLINLKDIVATNLPYSIVTNIIKNALMLPAYYRGKATNDISAEIYMVMSIIFKRLQERWRFLNIKHIHIMLPNFIQLLATRQLRSGTQEQRDEYTARINSYDSFFTSNEKTLLTQMLKSTKITEEDELDNEEFIDKKMEQYVFLNEREKQSKRSELESKYAQREYGYKKWINEFKQKILSLFMIKDFKIQQIWGYYTENEKQLWYIWYIKFIDEIARTPVDNCMFRIMIKTHEIIQRDFNLERVEKLVNDIQNYEHFNNPIPIPNIKGKTVIEESSEDEAMEETSCKRKGTDKASKQINHYMWALEKHYDHIWQLLDEYIVEITKQLHAQKIPLHDLSLEEEVKLIDFIDDVNYNIKVTDPDESPYTKLLRAARKKACKIVALAIDTMSSIRKTNRWNQEQTINEFIKLLKLYTGKNSYNDNRKFHLLDMEIEGLINKEVF